MSIDIINTQEKDRYYWDEIDTLVAFFFNTFSQELELTKSSWKRSIICCSVARLGKKLPKLSKNLPNRYRKLPNLVTMAACVKQCTSPPTPGLIGDSMKIHVSILLCC